ncbi:MAG: hypothetical protein LBF76_01505 [Holosporales bacterium]|nr:hypothetical protein [Holosporales bacterium]
MMKLSIALSVSCVVLCTDIGRGMSQDPVIGGQERSLNEGRPKVSRQKFTPEEDAQLKEIVEQLDDNIIIWPLVAQQMPKRNARQCRERWNNYLAPSLTKRLWDPIEDVILLTKYREIGSKWKGIAVFLPGRSPNTIENRWRKHLRGATWSIENWRGRYLWVARQPTAGPVAQPDAILPSAGSNFLEADNDVNGFFFDQEDTYSEGS